MELNVGIGSGRNQSTASKFCQIHLQTFHAINLLRRRLLPGFKSGSLGGHVVVMAALQFIPAAQTSEFTEDETPLLSSSECRICQEEDGLSNLETPCGCRGSLKYAHRKCVQHWCNEKGDITCEICHQSFQPDYSVPSIPSQSTGAEIDIRGWAISIPPLSYDDPHLLSDDEHPLYETEYEDYATIINSSGAVLFRMTALILMSLIIMRHALNTMDSDGEGDISTIFSIFFLRAIGFLLPCYIVASMLGALKDRRQNQALQEAETLAVSPVALVLGSSPPQGMGLQFTIASSPVATPHQLPL